ncbi:uncharacterized protein BDZ99DRAFT_272886 [Mytilinidion resinicola]|uniref:MFS general substrate transporter n=1 Tax=Mytilinidion resinicola TaxID=574789 RepID=A0A6A6YXT0_9PEZI|nr:uncharacterized protein BDZ99DRAFT_272886 [Mytilinidion resinicola]KAF2812737.1 hypothetical protein BDZ99DRAFT_272886 [Mytilinidion resinicola]
MFANFRGFFLLITAIALANFSESVLSSFWPSNIIPTLYASTPPDPFRTYRYLLAPGIATVVGGLTAGLSVRAIGCTSLQFAAACFVQRVFIGLMATLTPNSIKPGLAFTAIGDFAGGYMKVLIVVKTQLAFGDELIGTGMGVMNLTRGIGPAYALCFYLTILSSQIGKTLAKRVAAAVLPLGLPITSLASQDQAALMQVLGTTLPILGTAVAEPKLAYTAAFRICYYVGMATGLLACVLALFTNDVRPTMTTERHVNLADSEHIMLSLKPKRIGEMHRGVGQHDGRDRIGADEASV